MIWTHNHLSFLKIKETENNHCGCIVFGKSSFVNAANSSVAVCYYMLQVTVTKNRKALRRMYLHFPNWLRHRAFLLLVSWMTSKISPRITGRSLPPGFFTVPLGSTIIVCSALREPSYWEGGKLHQLFFFFLTSNWGRSNLFYLRCEIILP